MKTFVDHDTCTSGFGERGGEQDRGPDNILGISQDFAPSIWVERDALGRLGAVSCRVHNGGGHNGGGLDREDRESGSTKFREISLNKVNRGPGKLETRVRTVVANCTTHEPWDSGSEQALVDHHPRPPHQSLRRSAHFHHPDLPG